MKTITAYNKANIKFPGHLHTDANIETHQTPNCTETKLTWPDGFEVEYKLINGKCSFETNGVLIVEDNNEYSVIYPDPRKD